ncbi:hypothetical protein [Novipirellula galeiformis]|uniref:hypothetical protein n=1 Tax=Novipirellula galeiformis TaxID=2528004 RepID=UPI0018CF3E03|nr:hypothetical protein [Novipirellula galeiformis]
MTERQRRKEGRDESRAAWQQRRKDYGLFSRIAEASTMESRRIDNLAVDGR